MWFYHDDYGYISLHYGHNVDTVGMNYNLEDIFEYLKWHYLNWGGRVLFFFFQIVLVRVGGLTLIRLVQSIIITGIMYEIYLMIRGKKQDSILLAVITIMLWGTFSIYILRDGVYWFTASVLYTWPLLFFFAGILIIRDIITIKNVILKNLLLFFLFFVASFSQEQIAVMVVVYCLISSIFYFLKKIKMPLSGFIGALAGSLIEILAPGNFVRAGNADNASFYALSLFEKVKYNAIRIINMNVGRLNLLFVLSLFLLVFMGCLLILKEFDNQKKVVLILIINFSYPFIIIYDHIWESMDIIFYAVMAIWVLNGVIFIIKYSLYYKEEFLLTIFFAGLCSQAVLIISPTLSHRSVTIFQFIICIIALSISDRLIKSIFILQRKKNVFLSVLIIFAVLCFGNILGIWTGYFKNNTINRKNDIVLRDASEQIKQGEAIEQILCYKLYSDIYANDMPYNQNKSYILYWIKDYYEIPQNVTIVFDEYSD